MPGSAGDDLEMRSGTHRAMGTTLEECTKEDDKACEEPEYNEEEDFGAIKIGAARQSPDELTDARKTMQRRETRVEKMRSKSYCAERARMLNKSLWCKRGKHNSAKGAGRQGMLLSGACFLSGC